MPILRVGSCCTEGCSCQADFHACRVAHIAGQDAPSTGREALFFLVPGNKSILRRAWTVSRRNAPFFIFFLPVATFPYFSGEKTTKGILGTFRAHADVLALVIFSLITTYDYAHPVQSFLPERRHHSN